MITWTVTDQEADIIARALYTMPYAQVADLIAKLRAQAQATPEPAACTD